MKKYVKILSLLSLVTLFFTGCENFLSGSNLQNEIQDMLDYQYAESIHIKFELDNLKGTARSDISSHIKPTKEYTASFKLEEKYAFTGWELDCITSDGKNSTIKIDCKTNSVVNKNDFFDLKEATVDEATNIYSLKITILKTANLKSITVKPQLLERPLVTENLPKSTSSSVSRQEAITVTFNQEIKKENFRFTEKELVDLEVLTQLPEKQNTYLVNEGCQVFKDEEGEYYAYQKDEDMYFKNIEITSDNGLISLIKYFKAPVLDNINSTAILTIPTDENNLIELETTRKLISVNISKEVKNNEGIGLVEDKFWSYYIDSSSIVKTNLRYACEAAEGTLDESLPLETRSYNLGEKIDINFTPNEDYQFLRWDFDESIVSIPDYKNASATVFVKAKTEEGDVKTIKAVCAPRLKVLGLETNSKNTGAVPKNTSVTVKFNETLPSEGESLNQLKSIRVATEGNSVKSCFATPVVSGDTIIFNALKTNMIEVEEGMTKIITITIPSDFYYEYEYKKETYKVTVNEETELSYTINSDIDGVPSVMFIVKPDAAGTITPGGTKKYVKDSIVKVELSLNTGYLFNGWTVTDNEGKTVDASVIKLDSLTLKETKLNVLQESAETFTITANCSEKLNITDYTLIESDGTKIQDTAVGTSDNKPAAKDTGIEIQFNKPLSTKCKISDIKISLSGKIQDYSKEYEKTISTDRKTLTIKNINRLNIDKEEKLLLTVTVPGSFSYMDGNDEVKMGEDKSISYYIDYKTKTSVPVYFYIVNGETNVTARSVSQSSEGTLYQTASGSSSDMNNLDMVTYYLDETVQLNFAESVDYQFYKWECNDPAITIGKATAASTTLKMTSAPQTRVSVTAIAYPRPVLDLEQCFPAPDLNNDSQSSSSPTERSRDTKIKIKFTHAIDSEAVKNIKLEYTGDDEFTTSKYYNAVLSENKTLVTFNPKEKLPFTAATEKITIIVPGNIFYYPQAEASLIKKTPITMSNETDSEERWTFVVNDSTSNKTEVQYNWGFGSLKENGIQISNAKKSYNTQDSIDIEYVPSTSGHRFNGWKVQAAGSAYVISNTDFTKEGSVTVKYGDVTYFTLKIDSQNPEKAKAIFNQYVESGTYDYGIAITAQEFLVPVIQSYSPVNNKNGVECDKPIVINFNKPMKDAEGNTTVSLYDPEEETGSIKIVAAESTGDHYEEYFTLSWSANNQSLTLDPRVTIYEILGSTRKLMDLKVILDKDIIKDAEGYNLEETSEWVYKINQNTCEKTKIKFSYGNDAPVRVNGTGIMPETEYLYNVGQQLTIECIPSSEEYTLDCWDYDESEEEYFSIIDGDIYSKKITLVIEKAKGESSDSILLTPKIYQVPVFSYSPSFKKEGVSSNTAIALSFSKPMVKENGETTITLYNENSTEEYKGSLQIVNALNADEHFEEYIESTEWNEEKTVLTLVPKDTFKEIITGANTFDIKVILDSNTVKDFEGYKLQGDTFWTYRINKTTVSKTKLKFTFGNRTQLKINDGEKLTGFEDIYSVHDVITIESMPAEGYALDSWTTDDSSETYVAIADRTSAKTTLTVKKAKGEDSAEINVRPNIYLIPKYVTTPALTENGIDRDKDIVISFNKQMDAGTLTLAKTGSIQIVDYNNQAVHYENYYTLNLSADTEGNTVIKLKPKDTVYTILGTEKTKDIKIILNKDMIKDAPSAEETEAGITSHNVTGTSEWQYRLNINSASKVKVKFDTANRTIKVDGTTVTSDQVMEFNEYETVLIEAEAAQNYLFTNWTMECEGYTLNETGNVLDIGIASSSGDTFSKYFTIADRTSEKTTLTTGRKITSTDDVITIIGGITLIPKVETEPSFVEAGKECDESIVIKFNKLMDQSTLTLGSTGNIQIVNPNVASQHYESFYGTVFSTEDGKTVLTIRPNANIHTIFGTESTKNLKINLIADNIKDSEGNNLTGSASFDYLINNNTVTKTTVKYVFTNCTVEVNKVGINTGVPNEYMTGHEYSIKCIPISADYALDSWTINNGGDSVVIADVNADETVLRIDNINKATASDITVTPNLYLIPKTTEVPAFSEQGVECDKEIVFKFNKPIDANTLTLGATANIQIVSATVASEHYESYFTAATSTDSNGNTILTLKPNSTIYSLMENTQVKDLKINLNSSAIKDSAAGSTSHSLSQKDKSSFDYRINRNTIAKAKIQFDLANCTLKVNNATAATGTVYEYSINEQLTIECIPVNSGYALDEWQTDSSFASFISIEDKNALATTLKINKATDSTITVTPKVYLIPKVEAGPSFAVTGAECDKRIEITFNKPIDTSTLTLSETGSVQIVNAQVNSEHYEQYYSRVITVNEAGNTVLQLRPNTTDPSGNNVQNLFGSDGIKDIKIILNASGIKDTTGYALTENKSFDYRINKETEDKTNIQFNLEHCQIKVDGVTKTSGQTDPYSLKKQIEIECIPETNYTISSWTVSNPNVVSITEVNSLKTKLVVESVSSSTITVTPNVYLIPKVDAGPEFISEGKKWDENIVLTFNKPMNAENITLYNKYSAAEYKGSIQIVDAMVTSNHYEEYFDSSIAVSNESKTFTIKPKDNIYTILGSSNTKDIKIILDTSFITDAEAEGETAHNMQGTSSFDYRINSDTNLTASLQFNLSDCTVKVDGVTRNSGTAYDYKVGYSYTLECIPANSDYAMALWEITEGSPVTITNANAASTTFKVTGKSSTTATVTPNVYLIPKVETAPVFNDAGIECDKFIEIKFNKLIKQNTFTLGSTGSVQVVNALVTSQHYEDYFDKVINTENNKTTLILRPNANIQSILGTDGTRDLKILLDASLITDNEDPAHYLSGGTSFDYKLNNNTEAKTKIKFVFEDCSAEVDGVGVTTGAQNEYMIGHEYTLKCTTSASSGKALEKWVMTGTDSAVTIVDVNASTTKFKINSNSDAEITISPVLYDITKITSYPNFEENGEHCDKSLVFEFNRSVNTDTATFASDGSIQLYSSLVNSEHYETYYDAIWSNSNKTLTIKPKENTNIHTSILGNSDRKDLKIVFNKELIKDAPSSAETETGITAHYLTGTASYDYRINRDTDRTTKVNYSFANSSIYENGNVNAVSSSDVKEYMTAHEYALVCVPAEGYAFDSWEVTPSGYISVENANTPETTLRIENYYASTITVKANVYLIPKVNSFTPSSVNSGVANDKSIEITFNTTMDSTSAVQDVKIVSSENTSLSLKEYFNTPAYSSANKTLTVTPKSNIYTLLGTSETKGITVILEDVKDSGGHLLQGTTTYNYVINSDTDAKTTVNFDLSNCTLKFNNGTSAVTSGLLMTGKEYTVEIIPNTDYVLSGWTIPSGSNVVITDTTSLTTKIKVTEPSDSAVTVTPQLYLIPKVETVPSFTESGIECDADITITFNKSMESGAFTLGTTGSVQIIDASVTSQHYENKFDSVQLSDDGKTLTIKPNKTSIFDIFGSSKTKDIKIVLDAAVIKDNLSPAHNLTGTAIFDYRMNKNTSAKTTVNYIVEHGNVKKAGASINITAPQQYSNKEQIELVYTPDSGYALEEWKIADGYESYITISNKYAASTTLTVNGICNSEISVTPLTYFIPKVTSGPEFDANGKNWNNSFEIIFNKLMKESSLNLKDSSHPTGSIQIVDAVVTSQNYSDKFTMTKAAVDGKTVLTITPKSSEYSFFAYSETKDFKVILLDGLITDADATPHYLTGTTSFDYRINNETSTQTKIKYTFTNSSVKVSGEPVTSGSSSGTFNSYSTGKEYSIECIPSDGYDFTSWGTVPSGVTIADPSSEKTTLRVTAQTATVLEITPVIYLKPKVTTAPEFKNDGTNWDESFKIIFNKPIDLSTLTLKKTSNANGTVQIVNAAITSDYSYGNNFTLTSSNTSGVTELTISPVLDKYTFFTSSATKDIKIILDAAAIKDTDATPHYLTGTTSFDYRINNETSVKTKMYETEEHSSITINGSPLSTSSSSPTQVSTGQKMTIKNNPDSGYGFNSWAMQASGYQYNTTVQNKGQLKKNNQVYIEIQDVNAQETQLTVLKGITDSTVLLYSDVNLITTVNSFEPEYSSAGVACDSNIVIKFTKGVYSDIEYLYENDDNPGIIQILSEDEKVHYEQYFNTPEFSVDGKTITISPKSNIYEIPKNTGLETLKVKLDTSNICDFGDYLVGGTSSWTYKINRNTNAKVYLKFNSFTNCKITVDDQEVNSTTTYSYNVGQELKLKCIVDSSEYNFSQWGKTGTSMTLGSTKKLETTLTAVAANTSSNPEKLSVTVYQKLMIVDSQPSSVYETSGVNMDTPIVIQFNKSLPTTKPTLYSTSNTSGKIQIVNASNTNTHYEKYFSANWSSDGKTLTLEPNHKQIDDSHPVITEMLGTASSVAFNVKLASTITDNSSHTLADVYGSTGYVKKVTYTSNRNVEPPTVTAFTVKKSETGSALDAAIYSPTWGKNSTNHINKSVYVNCTALSTAHEVTKVLVEETFYRKVDGTYCNITANTDPAGYGTFTKSGDNYSTGFTYNLQSTEDGIVKLVFKVINNIGIASTSTYTYYVVRDTALQITDYYLTNENTMREKVSGITTLIGSDTYNELMAKDLYFFVDSEKYGVLSDNNISYPNVTFTIKYKNSLGSVTTDTLESSDLEYSDLNGMRKYILPCENYYNPDYGLEIKAKISDDAGNVYNLVYNVPKQNFITETLLVNSSPYLLFEASTGTMITYSYEYKYILSNNNRAYSIPDTNGYSWPSIDKNQRRFIQMAQYSSPSGKLITLYSLPITKTYPSSLAVSSDTSMTKPTFELDKADFKPSTGKANVSLKFTNTINENYDYYIVTSGSNSFAYENLKWYPNSKIVNKGGANYLQAEIPTDEFDGKYGIIAVNENKYVLSNSSTYTVTTDNIPPEIIAEGVTWANDLSNVYLEGFVERGYNAAFPVLNNSVNVNYFIIPAEEEWFSNSINAEDVFSSSEISSLNQSYEQFATSFNINDYDPDDCYNNKIYFPINDISDGKYLLVVRLRDQERNVQQRGVGYFEWTRWENRTSSVIVNNYSSTTTKFVISTTSSQEEYNSTTFTPPKACIEKLNTTTNTWEIEQENITLNNTQSSRFYYWRSSVITVNNGTVYRIRIYKLGGGSKLELAVPCYLFATEEVSTGTGSITQRNDYVVSINHNQPCIATTYSSPKPYTDASDWECFAVRNGVQMFNTTTQTTSNYFIDTNDVKSGDYYCVIVHFPNGQSQMTEVKQK